MRVAEVNEMLRALVMGVVGGAWGGAMLGLAEATLVTVTSASAGEYWLFPYAIVSYGGLGALLGTATALGAIAVSRWWRRPVQALLGVAAGVSFLLLGSLVGRYHVVQRIFQEDLPRLSARGLATDAVIVLVVGVIAVALLLVGRFLQRRPFGVLVAVGALFAAILSAFGAAALASQGSEHDVPVQRAGGEAEGHPNVILVIADTLRADALADSMPALQRFAADAVRFQHAYTQSSWTRPSVATILTGLYPSQHGAVHKMDPLPDEVTTIAEALGAHGYWSAGFVTNINVAPIFNFQQGFDEYVYLAPDFYFWASDSATRLAVYKGLRVARERLFGNRIYFRNYYQDAAVVDDAVDAWLEDRPPQPFFLLVHYMDPHDPYFEIPYDGRGIARVMDPHPPASRKDELQALYTENVRYLDDFLDRLFARLKRMGLYDGSMIVITSDHGEEFQEHGGWWHGTTLYEEQVHVPLLVKRPREPRAGANETRWARTVDVVPTIMAAAGLPLLPVFAGADLFEAGGPTVLFAEENLEGNVLASLRVGPWKIITANPGNPRGLRPVELYNLDEDPAERHDRAAEESERVTEMLGLLQREQMRLAPRRPGRAEIVDRASDHRS
jgi:arylsulfatase A-like enzyme